MSEEQNIPEEELTGNSPQLTERNENISEENIQTLNIQLKNMEAHSLIKHFIKYISVFIFVTTFSACETNHFSSDKRQISAKDEIRKKIGRVSDFDIISFREDTLQSWPDSNFRHPIQYTLNFVYKDSNNILQKKKGLVIFTAKRNEIISSVITVP